MASKTILLLGGTGKVAKRMAPLLSSSGYAALVASRSGDTPALENCQGVKFDWFDQSTWTPMFAKPISAIFLVSPPVYDSLAIMKGFIDLAVSHHVKRFVLLSASVMEVADGPMTAQVSKYLVGLGVEYAILRPTWFMQNFSEFEISSLATIRDEDCIISAAGDGKIPFVSCDDIAAVAFRALTDAVPHNTDYLIVGPGLFSYDEVAAILTKITGRKIIHKRITEDEFAAKLLGYGIPGDFARNLAQLDTYVKEGKEEVTSDAVFEVTGTKPRGLEDFLGEWGRKGVWNKK